MMIPMMLASSFKQSRFAYSGWSSPTDLDRKQTRIGTTVSNVEENDANDSNFLPKRFLESHVAQTLPLRLGSVKVIMNSVMCSIVIPCCVVARAK